MSSRPELRLDWCSHQAAKWAVEKWHYSRTIPTSKSARIGIWEGTQFCGAIIFGLGASPSLGKPYGLTGLQCCELTRVALRSHVWPVSRMLRIAVKMIGTANPGLRLIISFADTFHEHHGGIYQAANWIYAGRTSASHVWILPNGSVADPRRFNGHGFNKPKPIPQGSRKIKTPGKHRYLMPLDDEMRRRVACLAKPYPKRAGSADSGTPDNQSGRDGATPIPALPS